MTSIEQSGLRARHRATTRNHLYDAAVTLFAEKGYDNTSVEDIAERANVSRATAFNYFARKSDFVLEWGRRRRSRVELIIQREQLEDSSIALLLRRCISELAASHEADRLHSKGLMGAWLRSGGPTEEYPYLADLVAAHVREARQRGQVRPDVDADEVGHLFRHNYFGVLAQWLTGEVQPFNLEQVLLAGVDIIIAGIVISSDNQPS